jgi:predicted esterase
MMVGFHGYAENADIQLQRLRDIPGSERWLVVSVQGLHRFYRRNTEVVASWMTRQDRDTAIADNLNYVARTVEAVRGSWPSLPSALFVGFSQGVAMAFRAAVQHPGPVQVIAVGGDIPPELDADVLSRLVHVVICRGATDDLYPARQFARDRERLVSVGIPSRAIELAGGHAWQPEIGPMAMSALAELERETGTDRRG